ncbi:MAG: hypothetical protein UT24_C0031G0005 [Candidatus Woesebacteria bacterium GW2011_GWB1_39_12]|uniref:Glycosyltransferase RgtA/B/C/D-like domain-containing protein n=1 Tax=Candidatus Woesebacteria bacterium GW2011_GWB1_39_12 TaxID=1618574 RepID=A0A0G0MEZ4_9BACT|nr:MAG: hypothetical protein UT24_C0031G0005 [Candidatus Woesebacteria bacterium GW2011_GWB1_39_12]
MIQNFFSSLTTKKAILIIVVLGAVVFFNGLFNNFVGDDEGQILNNTPVHSSKNIPKFFFGSTFYNSGTQKLTGVYYKPILNTVFSLTYSLVGPSAFSFHLFQISLHILNACLLFLLFKHFFKVPLALVLSLIFLVHPINSEAVFYISNTQEPLFFLFGILALYLLTKAKSIRDLIWVSLLLFFSLLSKETGALFFAVAIIFAFVFNRKYFLSLLGFLTPLVSLYFLLRINAIGIFTKPLNAPIAAIDLTDRLLNIPAILFFYLKTFVFPLNLASSYHWVVRQISFNQFFLPLTIVLLFAILLVFFAYTLFKRNKERCFESYLFFYAWFILGIFIHLQILPLDASVAERWFYFPIVGLLGMAGVYLETFLSKVNIERFLTISMIIILLLSARTFIRSFDWRDQLTLSTHDIKVSKEAYNLENGISYALIKQGRLIEAKTHAEKSIELYPYFTNYNNLGLINFGLGNYQEAKEAYLNALKFGDYYLIYENLSALVLVYGDANENILFIRSAIKKFPQNSRMWLYLAILQYRQNNIDAAKESIQKAYYYGKGPDIEYVYEKIMNNQPLDIKFDTTPG